MRSFVKSFFVWNLQKEFIKSLNFTTYGTNSSSFLCLGNELRLNGSALLPIEEKSNQMFGATIVSSKNADAVLVGK